MTGQKQPLGVSTIFKEGHYSPSPQQKKEIIFMLHVLLQHKFIYLV